MSNGVLKAVNDKEIPSKQKKWPVPGGAQGGAIYIPDKYVFLFQFNKLLYSDDKHSPIYTVLKKCSL